MSIVIIMFVELNSSLIRYLHTQGKILPGACREDGEETAARILAASSSGPGEKEVISNGLTPLATTTPATLVFP